MNHLAVLYRGLKQSAQNFVDSAKALLADVFIVLIIAWFFMMGMVASAILFYLIPYGFTEIANFFRNVL